jgi:hypothetical protein
MNTFRRITKRALPVHFGGCLFAFASSETLFFLYTNQIEDEQKSDCQCSTTWLMSHSIFCHAFLSKSTKIQITKIK